MLFDTSNVFEQYLLGGLLLCKKTGNGLKRSSESSLNVKNLVYGTDWPFVQDITPERKVKKVLKALIEAGFEEEEIGSICHKNIERFL